MLEIVSRPFHHLYKAHAQMIHYKRPDIFDMTLLQMVMIQLHLVLFFSMIK